MTGWHLPPVGGLRFACLALGIICAVALAAHVTHDVILPTIRVHRDARVRRAA